MQFSIVPNHLCVEQVLRSTVVVLIPTDSSRMINGMLSDVEDFTCDTCHDCSGVGVGLEFTHTTWYRSRQRTRSKTSFSPQARHSAKFSPAQKRFYATIQIVSFDTTSWEMRTRIIEFRTSIV